MSEPTDVALGWHPDEIAIGQPTRNSRLRWAVVVDAALSPGEAANASPALPPTPDRRSRG